MDVTKYLALLDQFVTKDPGRGGGTPHMKGERMLVGNFELNP